MSNYLLISTFLQPVSAEKRKARGYEVWASDQSNSIADASAAGTKGSFIWIWNSKSIERQVRDGTEARPLPCAQSKRKKKRNKKKTKKTNKSNKRKTRVGPCNLLDVFPQNLKEFDASGNPTGSKLSDLTGFGRLHGMTVDPQHKYVTANIFAPSGGYVGVIDTKGRQL